MKKFKTVPKAPPGSTDEAFGLRRSAKRVPVDDTPGPLAPDGHGDLETRLVKAFRSQGDHFIAQGHDNYAALKIGQAFHSIASDIDPSAGMKGEPEMRGETGMAGAQACRANQRAWAANHSLEEMTMSFRAMYRPRAKMPGTGRTVVAGQAQVRPRKVKTSTTSVKPMKPPRGLPKGIGGIKGIDFAPSGEP